MSRERGPASGPHGRRAGSGNRALHARILEAVARYAADVHGAPRAFVPGKTVVPYGGRVFDGREIRAAVDASLEFWLTAGRYAARFEERLASYIGVRHALLTNSGSSANLLALSALTSPALGARRIGRGDEVITVAAGFPTTVAPIIQHGCVPVFVDVDPGTRNVDVSLLPKALSRKTKAVFLAHTLGNPFDVDAVTAFCRRHGLWLIEDNCDALGSEVRGRRTGSFGDLATCSFYPPHHMTMGEGGAVLANDPMLARLVASFRDWGRDCWCPPGQDNTCGKRHARRFGELPFGYDHKYVFSHFGYNLKVTDLQAAIGCAQLDKLPAFVRARRRNHAYLLRSAARWSDRFILPEAAPGSVPSWFGFLLTVRPGAGFTRDGIVAHLEGRRIQTRMLFAGNLVRHPCFDAMRRRRTGYRIAGPLANTDAIMNDAFWIGVYPGITPEMRAYMARAIDEYASAHRPGGSGRKT